MFAKKQSHFLLEYNKSNTFVYVFKENEIYKYNEREGERSCGEIPKSS